MFDLSTFGAGIVIGSVSTGFVLSRIYLSTLEKRYTTQEYENISEDLEKRRHAYDLEVDSTTEEGGLFPTHPGAHYLEHIATKRNENLTKPFDTGQLSASMNNEGVEMDTEIRNDQG